MAGVAFAGSYPARVYRSVHSTTSVTLSYTQAPLALHLEQNYPNPFNPSTQISFHLPEAGHTQLRVYDLLGGEVRTLVNEFKQAGEYSIRFNASQLASGLYTYRLQHNGKTLTRKMLLAK